MNVTTAVAMRTPGTPLVADEICFLRFYVGWPHLALLALDLLICANFLGLPSAAAGPEPRAPAVNRGIRSDPGIHFDANRVLRKTRAS